MRSHARGGTLLRLTVGIAAAPAIAVLAWPAADAQDAAVTGRKAAARRARGGHRKAAEIERLRRTDSSSARAAIKALADDASDATALTAIGALCREDFSGARRKLKSILEDEDRSDGHRRRATLGLRTARAVDAEMAVPYDDSDRARLGDEVRRRRDEALQRPVSARARRVLCREAVLAVLEENGWITRTRGGRSDAVVKHEGVS